MSVPVDDGFDPTDMYEGEPPREPAHRFGRPLAAVYGAEIELRQRFAEAAQRGFARSGGLERLYSPSSADDVSRQALLAGFVERQTGLNAVWPASVPVDELLEVWEAYASLGIGDAASPAAAALVRAQVALDYGFDVFNPTRISPVTSVQMDAFDAGSIRIHTIADPEGVSQGFSPTVAPEVRHSALDVARMGIAQASSRPAAPARHRWSPQSDDSPGHSLER